LAVSKRRDLVRQRQQRLAPTSSSEAVSIPGSGIDSEAGAGLMGGVTMSCGPVEDPDPVDVDDGFVVVPETD
jgi:hypothetical protein